MSTRAPGGRGREDHTSTNPGESAVPEQGVIRVLLCDDVPEFRTLMRLALKDEPGLEVVGEAGDGASCIAKVARLRPDVVLLDLSMPSIDGIQVIRSLRRHSAECAIVVLSGLAASRMRARAIEAGADSYLEKGASFEEIQKTVHTSVRTRRGR
ncbi:MAG: response regulator [Actinobacteria bacterium]|nr:MAG: response regulator [Actinomycetota bacterium]